MTGITVAVSPPTQAVDLSPGTQVVSTFVVPENKLTIKHGQQEIKVSRRTRLVAGETNSYPAGTMAPAPKPSASKATRDSSTDEHREHRGGIALLFDFTAGLARIFDPLGSLPPPSAAAAPSFIQSVLGKGYELATIHGYQDDVHTSPPTSTGSDGAGSSS
ncbi:hypothetical protein [Streptomyces sp. YS-3]|uniref:hypothetical protein n=1 Tax=Streptomyces sp. YS-3 TaxID=3381352 RepID=UPI003862493C